MGGSEPFPQKCLSRLFGKTFVKRNLLLITLVPCSKYQILPTDQFLFFLMLAKAIYRILTRYTVERDFRLDIITSYITAFLSQYLFIYLVLGNNGREVRNKWNVLPAAERFRA